MNRAGRARLVTTFALALVTRLATPVFAVTHREAIVIGHNAGAGERPLRYAESDAARFARVLVEIGGVGESDLELLQGRPVAELRAAFDRAQARVRDWHREPDSHVLLFVFYSGHSDGQAFEMGNERLSSAELRRWMETTGADVKLAIVDSCRSGSLLTEKGGTPGPSFQVRLEDDDLHSTGFVALSSSARDELALESSEIRGSFFTHHFVSGLLGQADSSGDGRVTLAEAYEYAYAHTLSDTARTTINTQHPSYVHQLSGRGELVLTEPAPRNAVLALPTGFDRFLITRTVSGQVLAEVPPGMAPRPLRVTSGGYAVRAWRGRQSYAIRVTLIEGQTRLVTSQDLVPQESASASAKGTLEVRAEAPRPSRIALAAGLGVRLGMFPGVAAVPVLRLGIRLPSGFTTTLDVAGGPGDRYVETSALLAAGYRIALSRGRFRLSAGAEAGGGFALRHYDLHTSWSPVVGGVVAGGGAVRLTTRLSLALDATLLVGWVRADGLSSAVVLPGGWLGIVWET